MTDVFFFADAAGSPGMTNQWIIMALLFAGMWFLMIAPQRKRQKEHRKMLENLSVGDKIMTSSGIYGKIKSLKDDRFVMSVTSGAEIEIGKPYIQAKVD